MALIALYGGSFNPSTDAHRTIGLTLLSQLKADQVWLLVSPQNPFKSRDGMASFYDRMAMAELNAAGHKGLVAQPIEAAYAAAEGCINTADTLRRLTNDFPQHRFIWAMGADNFADFHTWEGAKYIADTFPLAILGRSEHIARALASPSALAIPQVSTCGDMLSHIGWKMLDGTWDGINATSCRAQLALGLAPSSMRPEVAQYALANGVYATAHTPVYVPPAVSAVSISAVSTSATPTGAIPIIASKTQRKLRP
jgi:nicotinate-nucleotide adenylyltransferase